jgi:hypothetical protein
LQYYPDGAKSPIDEATAASYYKISGKTTSFASLFLGYTMESFDAELYAICECIMNAEIDIAKNSNIRTIWIFTGSQSVLKRLENSQNLNFSGQKKSILYTKRLSACLSAVSMQYFNGF